MIIAVVSATLLVLAVVPIIVFPIILLALGYWMIASIILVVYYVLNFIALGFAYKWKRTDDQAKITWTFIQVFLPGVGAYIYFVFARVPRKQLKLLKESELLENEILKTNVTNSQIDLLKNGNELFPRLFSELEKAKSYINIQYFIMNPGIIHDKLFDILKKKVQSGVKVRVLFDYLGNTKWKQININEWNLAGIETKEFRKIKWLKASGGDNYRSHNKIVVIDGNITFFGGLNIGDEYISLSSKYGDWIDTHYLGVGEIVEQLDNIFAWQWHIETRKNISNENKIYKKIEKTYDKITLLNDSPERPIPITFNNILELINNSKSKIKIISPYVAFPISIKQAFRDALNRGVEVTLITIGKADKKSSYYQSTFDTDTLTELGAKIYRMNDLFIHSKMFIFDDEKVIVGTTNLDYRSFFHHFEFNIKIESNKNELISFNNYFDEQLKSSSLIKNKRSDWSFTREVIYLVIRFFKGMF